VEETVRRSAQRVGRNGEEIDSGIPLVFDPLRGGTAHGIFAVSVDEFLVRHTMAYNT
jgi:hypothetical protein